jgi:hypothetical protein
LLACENCEVADMVLKILAAIWGIVICGLLFVHYFQEIKNEAPRGKRTSPF